MATTSSNVQAYMAYRETLAQIGEAMETLQGQLHAHHMAASAVGTNWGHVGDLTSILALLKQMTRQE
jgi:hypothetical protein